jgi:hypothetical protein
MATLKKEMSMTIAATSAIKQQYPNASESEQQKLIQERKDMYRDIGGKELLAQDYNSSSDAATDGTMIITKRLTDAQDKHYHHLVAIVHLFLSKSLQSLIRLSVHEVRVSMDDSILLPHKKVYRLLESGVKKDLFDKQKLHGKVTYSLSSRALESFFFHYDRHEEFGKTHGQVYRIWRSLLDLVQNT